MSNEEGASSSVPTEEKKLDQLNIKVVSQGGAGSSEVYFKIKKTTPLRKLMDAYCEKQGKQPGSMRFLFDGKRINPQSTPESLGMENEDMLEVMNEQYGGSF